MRKFRFRQFSVYQDALLFNREVKDICRTYFPKHEQYSLTSQICRALDLIILNIAEGADRGTDRDFAHFLNLSHTPLNEVVACLDLALNSNYVNQVVHVNYLLKSEELANQLTAFRKKLLESPSK